MPPEPPVPPSPQPPLPPGPIDPLPGPDLILAASLAGGADVAVTETVSPRVSAVGDVVSVTTRVRNNGPLPGGRRARARDPAGRPATPIRWRRSSAQGRATGGGMHEHAAGELRRATLPVGAEVVHPLRARMLVAGLFKSVIVATSRTPDPNTTNNSPSTGSS